MYQQLWGYKVEVKLYLGVRKQKRLNTTDLHYTTSSVSKEIKAENNNVTRPQVSSARNKTKPAVRIVKNPVSTFSELTSLSV
jgi:hypothetical protein